MWQEFRRFLDVFIHPGREDNPEKGQIAHAANLLQVGEFQVLQLAYRKAYGKDMDEHQSDRLFDEYMLHDIVPSWALRYADYIAELESRGGLREQDPTYHRYDSDYDSYVPEGARKFIIAVSVLAFVIAGAILVGHYSSFKPTSVLPPYFDEEEIKDRGDTALDPIGRPRNRVLQGS